MIDAITTELNANNTCSSNIDADLTLIEDFVDIPVLAGRKYKPIAISKVISDIFQEKNPTNSELETSWLESCSQYQFTPHIGFKHTSIEYFIFLAIAETITEQNISSLESKFVFTNELEINRFLSVHSFLITILREAYNQIQVYFPNSKVYLKISGDHESIEPYEELVAIIATDLSVKECMQQLDEFDKNWWNKNINRANDLLTIMV